MTGLLPPAKVQFLDQNGAPLAGGSVAFYVPGTTQAKATYQDFNGTANTNPVVLDSAGRAIVIGDGQYRQVVSDSTGAVIWDQVTEDGPQDLSDKTVIPTGTDAPETLANLLGNLQSTLASVGVAAQFSQPWGFSPGVIVGGTDLEYTDTVTGTTQEPAIWISRSWAPTADYALDFAGAPGASIPAVYVQGMTSGGKNIQAHGIMALLVNNGSQDAVAVSGRVYRLQCTLPDTGTQECAGYYGSAWNYSSNAGVTIGVEAAVLNEISGTTASDYAQAGAANGVPMALHVIADGTGSPAYSAVLIDGTYTSGHFGAWNGITIDGGVFSGAGIAGTIGLNCSPWDFNNSGRYPEVGMKMGRATYHFAFPDGHPVRITSTPGQYQWSSGAPFAQQETTAVDCGHQVISGTGYNSYFDFYEGTTHQASIIYASGAPIAGRTALGALCINDVGVSGTRINGNGGAVFIAAAPNGYGITWNSVTSATAGYTRAYRKSSTATDGAHDIYSDVGGTNTNVFRVQANGNVLNTNNAYGALSDERLKEHIVDTGSALAALNALRVRDFAFKSERAKAATQTGLIAQEVQAVLPWLVSETSTGNLSVAYSQLVPLLVKAVQEISSEIAALRAAI